MSTLAALRDLLRDESRWPEGFRFDYGDFETCAVGLAVRAGLVARSASRSAWGRAETIPPQAFGISERTYWNLFINGGTSPITPGIIAQRIDAYLAEHPHEPTPT
jgi:hypothetical protein